MNKTSDKNKKKEAESTPRRTQLPLSPLHNTNTDRVSTARDRVNSPLAQYTERTVVLARCTDEACSWAYTLTGRNVNATIASVHAHALAHRWEHRHGVTVTATIDVLLEHLAPYAPRAVG